MRPCAPREPATVAARGTGIEEMELNKRGLGRGLGALIPDTTALRPEESDRILSLPVRVDRTEPTATAERLLSGGDSTRSRRRSAPRDCFSPWWCEHSPEIVIS